MTKKLTDEKIFKKISEKCKKFDYEFIGFKDEWMNAKNTKLIIICKKDNYKWFPTYNNFIYSNNKCPKCSKNFKISKKEAIEKIKLICENKNFSFNGFFEKWKNVNSKLIINCNKDNYIWNPTYKSFIRGSGCPKCSKNAKIKKKDAYKIIKDKCDELNYNFEILNWKNTNNSKIKFNCKKDNYIWEMSYSTFINQNQNCPKCSNNIIYSKKETIKKIIKICERFNYKFLKFEKWTNASNSNIILKCNKDNYIWKTRYNNFVHHLKGCPKCSNKTKFINPFKNILYKFNLIFEEEKTYKDLKNIKLLRYDFYIPKFNLLIEINGIEHYNINSKTYKNYLKKLNYAKLNNIPLIEIPNEESDNISYFLFKLQELNINI